MQPQFALLKNSSSVSEKRKEIKRDNLDLDVNSNQQQYTVLQYTKDDLEHQVPQSLQKPEQEPSKQMLLFLKNLRKDRELLSEPKP